jgi:hypothetical protein
MKQTEQHDKVNLFGFPEALILAENGAKIARIGWNGKGMWLQLFSKSFFVVLDCEEGETPNPNGGYSSHIGDNNEINHIGAFNEDASEFYPIGDCLCMKTAQNIFELGWRPTSMDMLAKDWCVVS